jgi:hypothetical protein
MMKRAWHIRPMIREGEPGIHLDFPFEKEVIRQVKQIPGKRWSRSKKKYWHLPVNEESAENRQGKANAYHSAGGENSGFSTLSHAYRSSLRHMLEKGRRSVSQGFTLYSDFAESSP